MGKYLPLSPKSFSFFSFILCFSVFLFSLLSFLSLVFPSFILLLVLHPFLPSFLHLFFFVPPLCSLFVIFFYLIFTFFLFICLKLCISSSSLYLIHSMYPFALLQFHVVMADVPHFLVFSTTCHGSLRLLSSSLLCLSSS